MLEKLRQIENRYSELESKLADPAYYSDPAVFTKLCREQRELQPVVETYRRIPPVRRRSRRRRRC